MRKITAGTSSDQALYARLLVIHSRLSTLVSDVNLLVPFTFRDHVKSSAKCAFIGALAANSMSDEDTSDSNTMVACKLENERRDCVVML